MSEALFFALPFVFLAFAALVFRHNRARFAERLAAIAAQGRGRVESSGFLYFPRLSFPLEGAEAQVSAMPGGKNRSARTFVWVGCGDYPDFTLDVRRKPGRVGFLERTGVDDVGTGDREFDDAFRVTSSEPERACVLLDAEVRAVLLGFDPGLRVRVRVGSVMAYRGGRFVAENEPRLEASVRRLPPEVEDIEHLLGLAGLLHRRLRLPAAWRKSA